MFKGNSQDRDYVMQFCVEQSSVEKWEEKKRERA